MIELGKSLSQKPDKDSSYIQDFNREFLMDKCFRVALKTLKHSAHIKFNKFTSESVEKFNAYQQDLIPILIDTHELYKQIGKHCKDLLGENEFLLRNLFIQFHPEKLSIRDQISVDDIMKYCQLLERKDKVTKPKPVKNKPTVQSSSGNAASNNIPIISNNINNNN